MDSGEGGKKTHQSLDSLTKEDLIQRCKNLLQLAQKAKKAKDDAQTQNGTLKGEAKKSRDDLLEKINILESKNEDNQDIVRVKQRQLDRMSEENESLLEKIDVYYTELSVVVKEKNDLQSQVESLQQQNGDIDKELVEYMEVQANMICLRENEKAMTIKLHKMEGDLSGERKLVIDKNQQIMSFNKIIENKDKTLESLQTDLKESAEKNKDAAQLINREIEEEITRLKEENKNKTHEQQKHDKEIISIKKELDDSKSKLRVVEDSNKTCMDNQSDIEAKSSGLIEELNQLNEEMKKRGERIVKLEQITLDKQGKLKELESSKLELKSLKLQLETLLNELKEKNNESDTQTKVIQDLNTLNDQIKTEVKNLQDESSETTKTCSMLKEDKNLLEVEHKQMQQELGALINDNNMLRSKEDLNKNNVDQLEVQQDENILLQENLHSLRIENKEQLKKMEKSLNILEQNVAKKEEDIELLKHKGTETNDSLVNAEARLCKEEEKFKIMELEYKDLQSKHSEENITEKVCSENDEEKSLKFTQLNEELIKSQKSVKLKERNTLELQTCNDTLREEVDTLSNKQAYFEIKFNETIQEKELLKESFNSVNSNNAQLEQTLSENEIKFNILNSEVMEANGMEKKLQSQVLDLNCNLETLKLNIYEKSNSNDKHTIDIKTMEDKINREIKKNEKKDKTIEKLTSSVHDLEKEVITLNNAANQSISNNDDSRSEVMSTSTVSKVEENSRMRDIEDSFEERYSKLKLIAIKLKKKCGDQATTIKELETSKVNRSADSGLKDKFNTLNKNFTTLQSQYDQTVDKLENTEAELKIIKKDLEATMTECIANKDKSEESSQQALGAKTELAKSEDKVRELEVKVSSLQVTVDEERKERKILEEKSRNSDDLANQLKEKVGENFMIEETLTSLKLQVKQLEESLSREQERADQAHNMLVSTRCQLNNAEIEISKIKIDNKNLIKKHEDSMRVAEIIQGQNNEVIKKNEKEADTEKRKIMQLERQLAAFGSSSMSNREKLELKEKELISVTKEFEGYKLRAQSVLKKSKDKLVPEEQKKKEDDVFALERLNDALNDKNKSLVQEVNTVDLEKRVIEDEHEILMGRYSLLLQEIAGKERNWRDKSEEHQQIINKIEGEKVTTEERLQKNLESIRQLTLQEIETLKIGHQSELIRLKQQLDISENEVIRLGIILQQEKDNVRRQQEEGHHSLPRTHHEQLDIREIEREVTEGEALERSPGITPSQITSPVPLDQLLNGSTDDESVHDMRSVSRTGGTDRHLSHLSNLLSESETQNTRLEKLTEVLKEEIRTYQRSEERHKHIENLEYVKNVILKFLTLTGIEERTRLIPVLRTILKLKQEEVNLIKELVKVEDNTKTSQEGWSSYLWSSAP